MSSEIERTFMNIGHRGACGYRPENTLCSFQLALDMGIKHLECDVRFTKDREIVVIHDETVDRTTNGHGRVSEYTLSEIKELDAGSWLSQEYAGEQIPTLKELLDVLGDEAQLVVEIKDGIYFPDIIERVVAMVQERGVQDQVNISAFHWSVIEQVKRLAPGIKTSALVVCAGEVPQAARIIDGREVPVYTRVETLVQDALAANADIVCPPVHFITSEVVEALHEAGLLVRAWGLKGKDEHEMTRLVRCKANGMTTNYPDVLAEIYRKHRA